MIKLKDLLIESKRLNLFEQEAINLPAVEFDNVFNANYITINKGTWEKHAQKVVEQIQNQQKQGKRLEDLAVKINGQASADSATNRWDNKKNKAAPTHNFGGDPEFKGWVTMYLTDAAGNPTNELRAFGSGPDKVQKITKGNDYLAKERAEALRQKIVPYIQNALKFKMQIDVTADKVTDKTTKSAHAVVTSAVIPDEIQNAKYVIQYPWYKVGNQPNMVLVDGNIAAGWRQNEKGEMSLKWYQSTITDKNIIYSGFQKGGQAGGLINAYAFIKLNADSYRGSMAIYKDEKSWLADVKKMTIYAPGLQVGELTLGPPNSQKYLGGYRGAAGYLDRTGSSKYTGLAKFNMDSEDFIVSAGAPFYLFKPQGDKAFYMADLFKAKSQLNAPATGAYDSDGNRSLIVGKKYSVWDGVNITADNLARKIETGKAKKNPNALVYTGETTIETFKS